MVLDTRHADRYTEYMNNSQSLDQTVKGAVVGVFTWAMVRWNVDPVLIGAAGTVLMAVLAEVSKRVGVRGVASFLATPVETV